MNPPYQFFSRQTTHLKLLTLRIFSPSSPPFPSIRHPPSRPARKNTGDMPLCGKALYSFRGFTRLLATATFPVFQTGSLYGLSVNRARFCRSMLSDPDGQFRIGGRSGCLGVHFNKMSSRVVRRRFSEAVPHVLCLVATECLDVPTDFFPDIDRNGQADAAELLQEQVA